MTEQQYPYEKLGLLYLGRELDVTSREATPMPLLYKNKNMTTHGVIIGMTGSGKTGLGIGLIEEAIMDNIPSLIIDPKGDMGNLLLSFPENRAEDFLPWVDPAEAARKSMTVEDFAAAQARTWKEGLASWGQGPERIRSLREKTEMTIYTPGSSAGIPISVLSSFDAPDSAVLEDTDTLNSLVNATTTSLLALVDIGGDPLQSKEHILLSSLLLHFWRSGENLSMELLIGQIVKPPFDKIGVFSLDTFYPQNERMKLAMTLNNILASPTFAVWSQGEPLNIQSLLYNEDGRPRTAIFSLAHLGDAERMFFVAMFLNQFIGWMRRQQGASSLKALLYMDEIFGYFPPTANPPSKKPMLLLLKQARAFGVGVVLATQNPVDLDYKGLSNIGTWFVGRLQTKQDRERVVAGIASAGKKGFDAKKVRDLLANMKGRQFLLNSAHLDGPVLFETRWVMSYLKGPVSTKDIKTLMAAKKRQKTADTPVNNKKPAVSGDTGVAPMIPEAIEQLYFLQDVVSADIRFEPKLCACASVRFYNMKRNIDIVNEQNLHIWLDDSFPRLIWENAEQGSYRPDDCTPNPPSGAEYYPLPAEFLRLKNLRSLEKDFSNYLYQNQRLELFRVPTLGLESSPAESLSDFKIRLGHYLRDTKEEALEALREKYKVRQERLERKLDRALEKVEKEKLDVKSKTTDSVIQFGAAILGAFMGRKTFSASNIGRAATGMRNVGRVSKEKQDVKRAEENVLEMQEEIRELAAEIEEKAGDLAESFAVENYEIETFAIKPRRSDIFDLRLSLVWEMVAPRASGARPANPS